MDLGQPRRLGVPAGLCARSSHLILRFFIKPAVLEVMAAVVRERNHPKVGRMARLKAATGDGSCWQLRNDRQDRHQGVAYQAAKRAVPM